MRKPADDRTTSIRLNGSRQPTKAVDDCPVIWQAIVFLCSPPVLAGVGEYIYRCQLYLCIQQRGLPS
jgi:hypothetical protein